jgi:predicted  nucleic acid-binding Zn-ribbon protein
LSVGYIFLGIERRGKLNEEISKLIDLQAIDSEIDGFDQQIQGKEQEVDAQQQSITDKEEDASKAKENIEQLELKHRETKTDLDDAQFGIKERQNKMMKVQTSREHQALLKEIEDNKRRIKENEERLLQLMEQVEQAEATVKELGNLCKGEKKLLAEKSDEVAKAIELINARKKKVIKQRDGLAPQLHPGTQKRYEMLRVKRDGSAVVATINGTCQGCFMAIPPQQYNEVRKGDKINFCPTCQRILYYREEESETA